MPRKKACRRIRVKVRGRRTKQTRCQCRGKFAPLSRCHLKGRRSTSKARAKSSGRRRGLTRFEKEYGANISERSWAKSWPGRQSSGGAKPFWK